MISIVRIEPAPVTRPKVDEPSVVPIPLKLCVFERFCVSQLIFKVRLCSGPNRNDFAREAFQLNWHGPSIAPRCSSPYEPAAGVANAAVLKKLSDVPPQMPRSGFATWLARSEKFAPVPELFAALPPRITVRGFP